MESLGAFLVYVGVASWRIGGMWRKLTVGAGLGLTLGAGLSGCAAPPPVPAPRVAALPPPAIVLASRRLAPARLRADVLLKLTGSNAVPAGLAGYEVVVQMPDGGVRACVARSDLAVAERAEIAGGACEPAP